MSEPGAVATGSSEPYHSCELFLSSPPSLADLTRRLIPTLSRAVLTLIKQMVYRVNGPIGEVGRDDVGAGRAQEVCYNRGGHANSTHSRRAR